MQIPHGFCRGPQSTPDKRPNDHQSPKSNPRVHHIPIHIEGRESPDQRSFSPFTPPPSSNFTSDPTEVPVTRARSYSNSSNTNLSRSPSAASEAASHRSFSSASVDSNNNTSTNDNSNGKKVRQIPITLEYDPSEPSARRSGHSFGVGHSRNTPSPAPQYSSSPRTNSFASGPHVTNIPVNIKRSNNATAFTDAPLSHHHNQQQQQQQQHYQHQNAPKEAPPEKSQTPPAKSPVPPASHAGPKTPMDLIEEATNKLANLKSDIEQFTGDRDCKQYRYLDEMLTRLLISCDNIETNGDANIRSARKSVINAINSCIAFLESKTKVNQAKSEMSGQTNDETSSDEPLVEDVCSESEKAECKIDEPMQAEEPQAASESDETMQVETHLEKRDEVMTQEPDSTQGETMEAEDTLSTETAAAPRVLPSEADECDVTSSSQDPVEETQEQQVTEAPMEEVSQSETSQEDETKSAEKNVKPEANVTNDQVEGIPSERSDAAAVKS